VKQRHRSVYRVVVPPIVLSCAPPAKLLAAARTARELLNEALREIGVEEPDLARVEVRGPGGAWRKIKDRVKVQP
jgi:hypothetical protein